MSDKGKEIINIFYNFLPYYFRYINPVVHRYITPEDSLNENQIKLIMAINILKSVTPTELNRCLLIPKGSLTTIIRSLVKKELISKAYDEKDERKYYLSITQKGRELIQLKRERDSKAFKELFFNMDDKDMCIIADGFETLCKYLDKVEDI